MKLKKVEFFNKLIQQKLEQLPRAIEGKANQKVLNQICIELQILKNARDIYLYKI
jgi:hypothetical protein